MFHVAFQIHVQKLENQVQLLVRMHDIEKAVSQSCLVKAHLRSHGGTSTAKTHRTMFSSLSSFKRLISRIAVLGTPSSSASRRIFSEPQSGVTNVARLVNNTIRPYGRHARS